MRPNDLLMVQLVTVRPSEVFQNQNVAKCAEYVVNADCSVLESSLDSTQRDKDAEETSEGNEQNDNGEMEQQPIDATTIDENYMPNDAAVTNAHSIDMESENVEPPIVDIGESNEIQENMTNIYMQSDENASELNKDTRATANRGRSDVDPNS